jgi:hypothetical protein
VFTVYCDEKCKKLCAVEKVEDVFGQHVLRRGSLMPVGFSLFKAVTGAARDAIGALTKARRLGKDLAECMPNCGRRWGVWEVVAGRCCQRFYVNLAISAFDDWLDAPWARWLLQSGEFFAVHYSVYVALSEAFMRYVDDDGNLTDEGEALLTLNALRGR